ncbi:MAG TPA: MarR family transcriptional regulator [Balneolaceae bacterium]|nr:MarR family transcriptional regulator [Balneola sp.]HBQ59040.1 MarR family transcriptional regulator [Balneolaceae bacterium]|tara:strand:- start:21128 stop:21607 length:480 start_codon:yes stop_codon:yes gene_type:complete
MPVNKPSYSTKHNFVEDFSLKIEELGHPRIYGQILGWLLICDPPHQSFPDLMENLEISKASVSNMTRLLISQGLIEKVRIKGERQMYFKLKEGSIVDFMERQLHLARDLETITRNGLSFVKNDTDTDETRLQKANDFHRFLAKQTEQLIQKFKAENDLT